MSDNTEDPDKSKTPAPSEPPAPDISDVRHGGDTEPEPEPPPTRDISLDEALTREAKKFGRLPSLGGVLGIQQKDLKKKGIFYAAGGAVLLLLVLMVYSCQPKQGSMAFGICSIFLELNTPYPETLDYTALEGSRTAVRIYFTNIDPFGEYKLEMIECTFGKDEKMGMKLTEIKRNRRPVDAAEVQKFNALLPTIIASDPYRVAPPRWENPLVPELSTKRIEAKKLF